MFILLRFFADVFFVLLGIVFAYLVRFDLLSFTSFLSFPLFRYSNYLVFAILLNIIVFYFTGMYKVRKGFLVEIDEFLNTFFSISLSWIILIVLTFIRGEYIYSRPIILLSWPLAFVFVVSARQIILRVELWAKANGYGSKNALVVGSGELAKAVAERIKEHPSYGINLIGLVGNGTNGYIGKFEELGPLVSQYKVKVIYVADNVFEREKLVELAAFCDEKGLALGAIPDVFEILTTAPSVEDIAGIPIVSLKQTHLTLLNRFIKRTFDIVLALFGIIVFLVPMGFIAVLIKLTSPNGPIVYRQERVGRRGKTFDLLKFRTMVPNAETLTGPVLASEDDPRKTKLGQFLRMTKLDELPQLINILRGDMSFAGPRPERPVFVKEFRELIPKYMERHKIRPGLAGWAQLHGGYDMPAEEKIKYDLYYIENWSFVMDLKIILKCVQIALTFQRRN